MERIQLSARSQGKYHAFYTSTIALLKLGQRVYIPSTTEESALKTYENFKKGVDNLHYEFAYVHLPVFVAHEMLSYFERRFEGIVLFVA